MPFTIPDAWPLERESQLAASWGQTPSLANAWTNSRRVLADLQQRLTAAKIDGAISIVAVAGSLGRLESAVVSDVDTLIVATESIAAQAGVQATPMRERGSIEQAIHAIGYTPPKPGGVFAEPASAAEILAAADVGKLDESVLTYGKRIHFLLEAQPVWGCAAHEELVTKIVQRWGQSPSNEIPWWVYLQNDILRYWRALQIDYQWRHREDPARFWRRHAKLHFSRRTAAAGLIFLLGAATTQHNGADWLAAALRLTPLERVAAACAAGDAKLAPAFLTLYDSTHSQLADGDFLRQLDSNAGGASGLRSLRHSADTVTRMLANLIASRPRFARPEYWDRLIF